MKRGLAVFLCLLVSGLTGCAPLIVGGTAAGGYKAATDERSVGRMVDDTTLSANVKSRLAREDLGRAYRVDVDVVEGVVYLTGVVPTRSDADRAVAAARSVEGVRGVESTVQVGSRSVGQSLDDKVIFSKIKGKLIKTPGIRSLNIDVDVYNGVVTLVGLVKTAAQRSQIIAIADSVSGVVRVVSKLRVKP